MLKLFFLVGSFLWGFRPSSLDIHVPDWHGDKHFSKHPVALSNISPSNFQKNYKTAHFTIHYNITGDSAVSNIDNNLNLIPDYIDNVALHLEGSWSAYITQNNWSPPPLEAGQTRYPVYVFDLDLEVYGYVQTDNLATGGLRPGDNENTSALETSAFISYMAIQNDFSKFTFDLDGALKITVYHEFFHAIQFGYAADDDYWFLEARATAMETIFAPEVTDNFNFLPTLLKYPDISLTSDSEDNKNTDWLGHEYASWPFFYFIYEKRGGLATLREIDEIGVLIESINSDSGIYIIDKVLDAQGSNFLKTWAEYGLALMASDQGIKINEGFEKASIWNFSRVQRLKWEDSLKYLGAQVSSTSDGRLQGYAFDFWDFSGSKNTSLKIESENETDFNFSFFTIRADLLEQSAHYVSQDGVLHINLPDLSGHQHAWGEVFHKQGKQTPLKYTIELGQADSTLENILDPFARDLRWDIVKYKDGLELYFVVKDGKASRLKASFWDIKGNLLWQSHTAVSAEKLFLYRTTIGQKVFLQIQVDRETPQYFVF